MFTFNKFRGNILKLTKFFGALFGSTPGKYDRKGDMTYSKSYGLKYWQNNSGAKKKKKQ